VGSVSRTSVIATAGVALALAGGIAAFSFAPRGHQAPAAATARHVTPPLRVVSVSPAGGSHGVDGAMAVTVTFNQPLPPSSPLPRLSPAIPGSWQRSADAVIFTPDTGFPPGTRVRVGVMDAAARDRSGYSAVFTTGGYSRLRLQQVLAQLGYLPMTWSPGLGGTITRRSPAAQLAAAYSPPAGAFAWRGGYPGALRGFWKQGTPNVLDGGAIAGFEADHRLPVTGSVTPAVWAALLKAAAAGQRNTHGYSYAVVSESTPESLVIWHDGRQVFSAPANTGIPGAPTALGTFFVYEKLPFQIMQGTNPDGSYYADPVEWVSYFNGGDAVHYFPRGSYGWPQSLGCVELAYTAAQEAYPYLPYGTLVTVTP
jgi:hypothetical protein